MKFSLCTVCTKLLHTKDVYGIYILIWPLDHNFFRAEKHKQKYAHIRQNAAFKYSQWPFKILNDTWIVADNEH